VVRISLESALELARWVAARLEEAKEEGRR